MQHQIKIATLVASIVILLLIGTALFHSLEGWSWIDSFYFTGITLTTVGYGDIAPTLPLTKILTVVFAFGGISIVLFSMTILAKIYLEYGQEKLGEVKDIKYKIQRRKLKGSFYKYKSQSILSKLKLPRIKLRKSF